jgi:hypothetical protein
MPHEGHLGRFIASAYGAIVLLATAWALVVDVLWANSQREHLLPDVVLTSLALPMSLTLDPMYQRWPEIFGRELVQVGWTAACGLAQAIAIYLGALIFAKAKSAA